MTAEPKKPWWRQERITPVEVLIVVAIIAALVYWLPPRPTVRRPAMTDSPRRPFYRRKRWLTALAVLWLAGYVAGLLPAAYVSTRLPATHDVIAVSYLPILAFAPQVSPEPCPYFAEVLRLGALGRQHRAAASD